MVKKHTVWIVSLLVMVIAIGVLAATDHEPTANAQGTNLLVNGSLERPYYGQGSSTRTVPNAWNMWVGAGAPDAFPHTDTTQVRDGEVSWNVKQGFEAFTAAGWQRVGGLQTGDVVRLTAYGWVFTCNDTEYSCVIPDPPYRRSDTSAGASLKVGVDPNGGTDPNAASVVWSAVSAPYDQWAEMSVTARAEGSAVTVFLYMTQTTGLALNNVYWDQVSLVRTDGDPVNAEPTAVFAPFVVPQGVRPDGSLVHVVQAGDTLSSIVYAYREYDVTLESLAELNANIQPNTRFLQLGQEIVILPPGSVDPVTGEFNPDAQPAPPSDGPSDANPVPPADAATDSPADTGTDDTATDDTTTDDDSSAPPADTTTPPPADDAAAVDSPADTSPLPPVGQDGAPDMPPPTYAPLRVAFLRFEQGYMFWLEDTEQIYVLLNSDDDLSGTFTTYRDTWRDGMPESDPELQPPVGLTQPLQNFGHAWRTYPGVRDALGWSTGSTIDYTGLVVRDNGKVLISGPDNRVYELMDGGWTATDFYAPAGD